MDKKTLSALVINIFFFVAIGLIALLFLLFGKPFMQGFYCDDTSISKPYSKSTVPVPALYISSLVLGIACFTFGITKQHKAKNRTNGEVLERSEYRSIALQVFFMFLIFMYGSGINMFVTNVGKYSIGRLRPHYISVCQPAWSKINCTDANGRKNLIFGDKICQTTNLKALKEAHLSFPSGHASLSGFAATFLILYLESQILYTKTEIVPKYFVQAAIGAAGFYVGLSRVIDYFHHPTDVLAGFVLGIFIAVAMHCSLIKFYYTKIRRNNKRSEDSEIIEVEVTPINTSIP